MHSYLQTIGFSKYDEISVMRTLLSDVETNPDETQMVLQDGYTMVVYKKNYGTHMGVASCGALYDGVYRRIYYYPYVCGETASTDMECGVQKQGEKDSYACICEDFRLGVSLIFYLTNYVELRKRNGINFGNVKPKAIYLSGLAASGKILLPIEKSVDDIERAKSIRTQRSQLIELAKNGDEDAIDTLTTEEMNTYTSVSRRLAQDDLYTVVDSFVMPFGIECDQYTVMGDILSMTTEKNQLTGEEVYLFVIESNDMPLTVAINKDCLLGIPEVGRRFKGQVWMQGIVKV